jgi:hypothetical protein
MTDLAMVLKVFATFPGGVRRIGDRVLYIFTADGYFVLHLIRHSVSGLAGRARLATAHRDDNESA